MRLLLHHVLREHGRRSVPEGALIACVRCAPARAGVGSSCLSPRTACLCARDRPSRRASERRRARPTRGRFRRWRFKCFNPSKVMLRHCSAEARTSSPYGDGAAAAAECSRESARRRIAPTPKGRPPSTARPLLMQVLRRLLLAPAPGRNIGSKRATAVGTVRPQASNKCRARPVGSGTHRCTAMLRGPGRRRWA